MNWKYLVCLPTLFLLEMIGGSHAQTPSAGIAPCASYSISVSSTSANQLLSGCGTSAVLWNIGTYEIFVSLGTTNSTVATTSNMSIPAGTGIILNVNNSQEYLAAITSSNTSTLRITQGWGFTALGGGGSGGGGGGGSGDITPEAGTASTITTGGTAVIFVTGPINGCYITNPLLASDQNIAAAEVGYVNPVTTATDNGYGTNSALQPGQSWNCPGPLASGSNVSANAPTSGHRFSVVMW